MGILIVGELCMAAEVFMIYFLVQLVRDSRRESRGAVSGATRRTPERQRFVRIELAPPVAKAVWREGRWQSSESRNSESLWAGSRHQLAGGKHRAWCSVCDFDRGLCGGSGSVRLRLRAIENEI